MINNIREKYRQTEDFKILIIDDQVGTFSTLKNILTGLCEIFKDEPEVLARIELKISGRDVWIYQSGTNYHSWERQGVSGSSARITIKK